MEATGFFNMYRIEKAYPDLIDYRESAEWYLEKAYGIYSNRVSAYPIGFYGEQQIPDMIEALYAEGMTEEGDNLYRSVSDLIQYATGAAACSTADLYIILMNINNSLDNIRTHLNRAYFETWRYIQVRIGYWKRQVYRAKTKEEIINDAFGRWKVAGYLGY